MQFTQPFHKLTKRHQHTVALLLYYHYKYSLEITNDKILWKEVFGYDTKVLISNELDVKLAALENLYSQLRKKKIIVDNKISPVYIPELNRNTDKFSIILNFELNKDE